MQTTLRVAFAAFFVLCGCKHSPAAAPPAQSWIDRSNLNAQVLLDVQARFFPEGGARLGIAGIDDRIIDLTPGHHEREREALQKALAQLEQWRSVEQDPLVAQDLGHPRRGGAAPGA